MPILPTELPAWLQPARQIETTAGENVAVGRNFMEGYDRGKQENLFREELKVKALYQVTQAQKLTQIAPELAATSSPSAAWDVVSKNPTWLVDPQTAPFVNTFLKSQAALATAQKNTTQGQIAIKDTTDFMKRMQDVDPETRAQVRGMQSNSDGTPSAMQWKVLGLATERDRVAKENIAKQAENEALARGDIETTVIGPKGVTTTFKPKSATAGNIDAEPRSKALPDGSTAVWMPGGKGIHIVKNGMAKEISPNTIAAVAKLVGVDDPDYAHLLSQAKAGVMGGKVVSRPVSDTAQSQSTSRPSAVGGAEQKAQFANSLASQNPNLSREEIIAATNQRFAPAQPVAQATPAATQPTAVAPAQSKVSIEGIRAPEDAFAKSTTPSRAESMAQQQKLSGEKRKQERIDLLKKRLKNANTGRGTFMTKEDYSQTYDELSKLLEQ